MFGAQSATGPSAVYRLEVFVVATRNFAPDTIRNTPDISSCT